MKVILYSTSSPNNAIGKVLTNETPFECKLKGRTNVLTPAILLQVKTPINFNYAKIPDWNRFYFIQDIQYNPNGFVEITLKCDVLESWKDDILNSTCEVTRKVNSNPYYNSDYESEVKKEIDKYNSSVTLDLDIKNRVLVTVGGV